MFKIKNKNKVCMKLLIELIYLRAKNINYYFIFIINYLALNGNLIFIN